MLLVKIFCPELKMKIKCLGECFVGCRVWYSSAIPHNKRGYFAWWQIINRCFAKSHQKTFGWLTGVCFGVQ